VLYMEPERQVISRSADECVVALCDQWSVYIFISFTARQLEEHFCHFCSNQTMEHATLIASLFLVYITRHWY